MVRDATAAIYVNFWTIFEGNINCPFAAIVCKRRPKYFIPIKDSEFKNLFQKVFGIFRFRHNYHRLYFSLSL